MQLLWADKCVIHVTDISRCTQLCITLHTLSTHDGLCLPVSGQVHQWTCRGVSWGAMWCGDWSGSVPEKQQDRLYNTSTVFSPTGNMIAKHRKVTVAVCLCMCCLYVCLYVTTTACHLSLVHNNMQVAYTEWQLASHFRLELKSWLIDWPLLCLYHYQSVAVCYSFLCMHEE